MKVEAFEYGIKSKNCLLDTVGVVFSEVSNASKRRIEESLFEDKRVFLMTEEDFRDAVRGVSPVKAVNPDRIACSQKGKTITLRSGGKKYSATPEKGEAFDAEKGVLICLLKMLGVSVTDILKITEKMKIVDKKAKTVK